MAFVFSFWYIVALVLVAGVAACLVVFFKMDKQDKVLIKEFVESNDSAKEAPAKEENKAE